MGWEKVGWDGGVERERGDAKEKGRGGWEREGWDGRERGKEGGEGGRGRRERGEERRVPACIFACAAFTNEGVSWCARGGCSNAKDKRV